MNVPIIDLNDGLTRLALAKLQQIILDASFVGGGPAGHVRLAYGWWYSEDDMRRWVRQELREQVNDVRLWLAELGLDAYAPRVMALIGRLLRGEPADADLRTSIMYAEYTPPKEPPKRLAHVRKTRSKSGYRGVMLCQWGWKASIHDATTRRTIHLGYHKSAEDAARAYNAYVIARGLDHPLNEIREEAA